MAGLFFMSEGDSTRAIDLLKETYGMVDKNPVVKSDFYNTERKLDGYKIHKHFVWVVFENGLGPVKQEFRVDLPLFLVTKQIKYTGIALPKLKLRNQAYPYLMIKTSANHCCRTRQLASMDRVIETEFKDEYPLILTRAIISALVKTSGQYLAKKKFGELGGWAAACYQGATTCADLRIWSALPKEFQVAKIVTPTNGQIIIAPPSGPDIKVQVPMHGNSLVYIKTPSRNVKMVIDVIKL